MRKSLVPELIQIAAVVTALPRWVIALLVADGMIIPPDWYWVHYISAIFGAGMAVLEGVAVAYIFNAITSLDGKERRNLYYLTIAMLVSFVAVLAPSIFARVQNDTITNVLPTFVLWIWAIAVPLATILTVMAVGEAQGALAGLRRRVDGVIEQWKGKVQSLESTIALRDQKVQELAKQVMYLEAQQDTIQADESVPSDKSFTPTTRQVSLMRYYSQNPDAPLVVAADQLGVSRETVRLDWKELADNNLVEHKNGNGRVVLCPKEYYEDEVINGTIN